MTLNTILRELKTTSRSKLAPETAAIMTRATEQLQSSGIVKMALGSGNMAPAFALTDWQGNIYNSAELLEKGPLILNFYRGSW